MSFWLQFRALFWKNWIILSKHSFLNIIRCFVLPVAYGIFLAVAQLFLIKPNNYGIGNPIPVYRLQDRFDGSISLVWADGTNSSSTGGVTSADIISHISSNFNDVQRNAIRKVASPSDIPSECPQNFNLFSECFAAVAFFDLPSPGAGSINYTIQADGGLVHIDVVKHTSDFEERILPLQWAIDQAIVELQTGVQLPTPLEWPFSQETNEEQSTDIRLSYIRGLRTLLVLALFVCFVGIAYQLPGAVTAERANLITSHMKAMGLLDSVKVLSWYASIALVYLPAWTIVSLIWHFRIFTMTSGGLIFVVHILLGLILASYSFFVAAPFGKSPQLAAVASTFLSIVFAILALVFSRASTGAAFIFSIIFPPGWYIFAIRAICGWENHQIATDVLKGDPDSGLVMLPLLIAAIIDVFLWPYLAVLLENRLYDARNPPVKGRPLLSRIFRSNHTRMSPSVEPTSRLPSDVAISIENLNKTFNTSLIRSKKGLVTAVADLSLTIPKYGIFVLLGSNGAGKSTTLSVLAGLTGRTSGSVRFNTESDGVGTDKPPPGTMGIVPQKNVLFPELTCYQTLRVWKAIKRSKYSDDDEDIEQLLRDCDLGAKIHANANTLSGGQKRKLQLAIGLVGGSNIVFVDECTSGVDPLSRRALWRTLTSFRETRTIVFTTHFLDEADLLGDHIAILAAPGKLAAQGSPVALKHTLGEGYTVQVTFDIQMLSEKDSLASGLGPSGELLQELRKHAHNTSISVVSPRQASYHLKTKDPEVVQNVLTMLDEKRNTLRITSYDVLGTSIEDIFLNLMHKDDVNKVAIPDEGEQSSDMSSESGSVQPESFAAPLMLTSGRAISPFRQALTIFHKRALIARRSWLALALAVLVAVAASTIPLVFVRGRSPSCVKTFATSTNIPLYLPESPIDPFSLDESSRVLESPPGMTSTLGNTTTIFRIRDVSDNDTFVNDIKQNFRNLSLGGVSIDSNSGAALVAWEATAPGLTGPAMLNLASNILYNQALNSSGQSSDTPTLILANYESFPPVAAGTLFALKWVAFFGVAMAVYPAFFAIYVSKERRSGVQAMQFSNGLSNTAGLWLGHLLFDWIFSIISATVIIIVFAAVSNQFHGLGLFWVVLVLYGIASTLFAYCMSLVVSSPLAAFAAVAGYQVIMFLLYLAGYLLTLTYAKTSSANKIITIIHFTLSVLSPVASTLRAAFVSVNLFSLLCLGDSFTTSQIGDILRFGGPILYLIVYSLVLMTILVWYDSSGSLRPAQGWLRFLWRSGSSGLKPSTTGEDVLKEAKEASASDDLLRVVNVSKTFGNNKVVDNVSLGVSRDTIFALLGPNGAGKTTTFNMIRGDILLDTGDIFIADASVVRNPKKARFSLGVCPQFTAIDSQMTVREHLLIYGQLKGVTRGAVLANDIVVLLRATGLAVYADRLASKLSGGNQRKLSLAIALIGNPAVVLIDEFSTGIDAKMKREMWKTLRNVAVGKSVIITTHSMEEASALATKVGILARRMLAVGTTESLSARYATYEVHFTTRNREEVEKAQILMSKIPGARIADDVATRFEVPIQAQQNDDSTQLGGGTSLAQLFHVLSSSGDFTEYTVEKASLESVFLKVIRENKVLEEDTQTKRHWWQRQR